jgi:hypothetical protein
MQLKSLIRISHLHLTILTSLPGASSPHYDTLDENDQFFLPFHLYTIPDQVGRWKSIRISGCKKVVLSSILLGSFMNISMNIWLRYFYHDVSSGLRRLFTKFLTG